MGDYSTPGSILQIPSEKRNFLNFPTSVCEMVHKTHCLHQLPRLVVFSLEKKEGKNEKDLYIRNYFDGADSLRSAPDSGGD
jgi:hypothetical protein